MSTKSPAIGRGFSLIDRSIALIDRNTPEDRSVGGTDPSRDRANRGV